MIDKLLGDKDSIYIHTIKDYWDAENLIRYMFPSKARFDELVDKFGPFHWVRTNANGKWLKWLAQKRDGEWFIYRGGSGYNDQYGMRIDEGQLLSYMGISMLGIPLDVIIDNYSYEY
jgi:hypothetical protein